jgi:hypothetical protein
MTVFGPSVAQNWPGSAKPDSDRFGGVAPPLYFAPRHYSFLASIRLAEASGLRIGKNDRRDEGN